MSTGSRIVIGIVVLLCAAGFVLSALDPGGLPGGALAFYGLAAFCVVIAVACFFPQSHLVTLRVIGAAVFCTYIAYVLDSFRTQNLGRAVLGFLVWGIPSGYLAIMGKYPLWGKGASGFNARQSRSHR